ncbi:MAG: DUF1552 domain-containing protein [Sandaracinaceae bacterium]|nr:DUF1552 domain-containing protein [Sandaracinaceae bacterium]
MTRKWNRRTFLTAAGIGLGAGAMAPFFPTTVADAEDDGIQRLFLFTHPNGSIPDRWRHNGAGDAFRSGEALPTMMGPMLAPLDRHRERLVLLDGVDITSSTLTAIGDEGGASMLPGHSARTVLWSGARMIRNPAYANEDHVRFHSNGPSIDQLIGRSLGTRFGSLVLGTTSWLGLDSYSVWSFRGASDPEAAIIDPQVTFDLLFGMVDGDATASARRRAERRSVLDVVRGELTRLRAELPSEDRDRFDRHVASVSDLERRVRDGAVTVCSRPDRPRWSDDNEQIFRLRAQVELAMAALACDLTRVVSLALGKEGGTLSWLDDGSDPHLASHESWGGTTTEARMAAAEIVTRQNRVVAEEVASMIDQLSARGLMESSILVWGTPMGWGGPHTNYNAPFVLASGRADLQTDRYHRWGSYWVGIDSADPPNYWVPAGGIPHNRLLTSLTLAMGRADLDRLGDAGGGADLDNTPIGELFA